MANPFAIDVGNPLQGLGQMAQVFGQQEQQASQQEAQQQKSMQTFQLLNEAQRATDPAQRQQLFMQAYQSDPEMVSGYIDTIKKQQEAGQVGTEKPMTAYQSERLKLDEKSLKLREIESNLRQEDNVNKRKSLENRVKKERFQLDKLERELAADRKGGAVQKMLRGASESDKKASSFARRMIDSAGTLAQLESKIDPTSRVIGFISGGKGITSEAANRMASADEQAYASDASDFVTAQLRQESGAAIGQDEFDRKYREFFPMPGDDDQQITLKRQRREAASKDMQNLSGGLYDALYGEEAQAAQQPQVPAQPQAQQYTEGQTARNPQTGAVLTYRGGQWQ